MLRFADMFFPMTILFPHLWFGPLDVFEEVGRTEDVIPESPSSEHEPFSCYPGLCAALWSNAVIFLLGPDGRVTVVSRFFCRLPNVHPARKSFSLGWPSGPADARALLRLLLVPLGDFSHF